MPLRWNLRVCFKMHIMCGFICKVICQTITYTNNLNNILYYISIYFYIILDIYIIYIYRPMDHSPIQCYSYIYLNTRGSLMRSLYYVYFKWLILFYSRLRYLEIVYNNTNINMIIFAAVKCCCKQSDCTRRLVGDKL